MKNVGENTLQKKLFFNTDSFAVGLLILILLIYMIPGLFAIDRIFFDDASLCFSRIVGVAQLVKSGEMPLWDPYTFTGARPYYAMVESPIYNIFLYPLFYLANLEDLNQSFIVLYMIPFTFLIIFAGVGAYFFTRKILNFKILSSFITGFLYAASPVLATSVKSIHNTHVFAYIPWVLLFIFLYIHTTKLRWWFAGIGMLTLLAISVSLNYVLRSYFLIGAIVFFSGIFLLRKKEISWLTFINSLVIFVIAFSLLAFIWTGMVEGASWIKSAKSFKYSELVIEPHFSMFPGYAANIFMQDFHGLISCDHAWGNAVKYDNNDLLSGGFLSSLLVFLAVYLYTKKQKNKKFNQADYKKEVYFWVFFTIAVVTVFVMMGRFTPVYFILCNILPMVYKFPYAYYFLFYQGFTYAILAGYGMDFLLKEETREKLNKNKAVFLYIGIVIGILALSMIEPIYLKTDGFKASIQTLFELKEVKWFIVHDVVLLAVFIAIAVAVIFNLKKSLIPVYLTAAVIIAEGFFFGYVSLYRNTMSPRLAENPNKFRVLFQTHYKNPMDHPLFKDVYELKKFYKYKDVRFIGTISNIDNLAWLIDKRSTFGYDSKPVIPEMYKIIRSTSENYPYELFLRKFPINLFRNLNVGYMLSYQYYTKNLYINAYDTEYTMAVEENIKPGKDWIEIMPEMISKDNNIHGLNLVAYKFMDPLPYFYFHDKFGLADDNAQFSQLYLSDLRERSYISREIFNSRLKNFFRSDSTAKNDQSGQTETKTNVSKDKQTLKERKAAEELYLNDVAYFYKLQEDNKVVRVITKKANTLVIEADIKRPSMLIRNESFNKDWSVTVKDLSSKSDKKVKRELLKINYIQQGLPLNPGKYIIEYQYTPEMLKKGLAISGIMFLFMLIYSFYLLYYKKAEF